MLQGYGRIRDVTVGDDGAIYLLIAGTYTPFCLNVLGGGWGWSLFGIGWGLAAIGIVLEDTPDGVRWHRG